MTGDRPVISFGRTFGDASPCLGSCPAPRRPDRGVCVVSSRRHVRRNVLGGVCRPYEPARQDPAMTLQQQAVPESYIAEQFLRATEDHLLGTRR